MASLAEIPASFLFARYFFLDVPIREPRWCPVCGEERLFVADRESVWGLIGTCNGCHEERMAPWTRKPEGL